jgi:hypothetical protein
MSMVDILFTLRARDTRGSRGTIMCRINQWPAVPRQGDTVVVLDDWDPFTVEHVHWLRDGSAHVSLAETITLDRADLLVGRGQWDTPFPVDERWRGAWELARR